MIFERSSPVLVVLTFACALTAAACDAGDNEGGAEPGELSPEEAKAALLECGLPEPCAVVELDGECCDLPPAEGISADEQCAYEALRDRSSVRLTAVYDHDPDEWANNYTTEDLFIWPSGELTFTRQISFNGQQESGLMAPRRAVLKSPDYFTNCLETTDPDELADCRSAENWYESTADLDTPACE